jgi:hypothetical protein
MRNSASVALALGLCLAVGSGAGQGAPEGDVTQADLSSADSWGHGPDGVNMLQSPQAVADLGRRAILGDDEAANWLGNHYSQLGDFDAETRWRRLAASRGHCQSLALLKESAADAGDAAAAARWNAAMRRHRCTWGKTYPGASDADVDDLPLWTED